MKSRRDTPRRRSAPRWTAGEWADANSLLYLRCNWKCEKCGHPLIEVERHHRQRRQVGGDRLANILMLHPRCHAWITEHPEEARDAGWIVSAYTADPAVVPVLIDGVFWLLDDIGGRSRVDSQQG